MDGSVDCATTTDEGSSKKYPCVECNKIFLHLSSYSRHKKSHSHANIADHTCETCSKSIDRKDNLLKHLKHFMGYCVQIKPFVGYCIQIKRFMGHYVQIKLSLGC